MQTSSTWQLDVGNRKEFILRLGRYHLQLGKTTRVMGILNVTPDSFSQDGIYQDPQRAKDAALKMAKAGADIIDIGGESTRPGSESVSEKEELARVIPVIKQIAKSVDTPISIDTTKAKVAEAALIEGASLVNDISGFSFDARMPQVVSRFAAGCVLMHIQGTPQTMQNNPTYVCLVEEIIARLREIVSRATAAGIDKDRLIIDPGIGFGKTTEHNLQIIKNLRDFTSLDLPILVGPSRKSFIGNVLKLPVGERLWGTAAAVAVSILHGAHIVRVHDVKEMFQVTRMVDAILAMGSGQ